jgi:A/G-specific adenine glycosylase
MPVAESFQAAFPGAALLRWYDRHRRRLPWRALPGETPDPYRVWLSEIMLQQTTAGAVSPYYETWLRRFPTLDALAAAVDAEVMAAWAGLGYYARARNLIACARQVAAMGGFPCDIEGLRALPGIGPYTAAAIGAIAFDLPVVPMDGNVERVVARLFAIAEPLPGSKPDMRAAADRLGEDEAARARPGDFAQALFDLGATVCTPTNPACGLCPWQAGCRGRIAGIAAELPRKAPKKLRPVRHGVHFYLRDAAGRVLLRRRPPKGLLGGMTELPGPVWRAAPWERSEVLAAAPMAADWQRVGEVRQGLTHFELRIEVFVAQVTAIDTAGDAGGDAGGFLHPETELDTAGLPSLWRKCVLLVRTPETSTDVEVQGGAEVQRRLKS